MGYLSIRNLYADTEILQVPEKELYALEKIHGTSANIRWENSQLHFYAGGSKHETFVKIFDEGVMHKLFSNYYSGERVIVYGEAYGGNVLKQSWRYGKDLKFVAFDVWIGSDEEGRWLDVPDAWHVIVHRLMLEFVAYEQINATVQDCDFVRDLLSSQALRNRISCNINGEIEDGRRLRREGVILRPLTERNNRFGERLIAKHKRIEEFENASYREVNGEKLAIITKAEEAAAEFVTENRLEHVISHLTVSDVAPDITRTKDVIAEMIRDVRKECSVEYVESKEVNTAIAKRTAKLFKEQLLKGLS